MAKRYIRPVFYSVLIRLLKSDPETTPLSVQKEMNWTEDDHNIPGIGQEIIKTRNAAKGYCNKSDFDFGTGNHAMNNRRRDWVNAGGKVVGPVKLDKPYRLLSGKAKGIKGSGSGISTTVSPDDDYTSQFRDLIQRRITKAEINQANLAHLDKLKKVLVGNISNKLLGLMTGVSEATIERYLSGYADWVSAIWLRKVDALFENS